MRHLFVKARRLKDTDTRKLQLRAEALLPMTFGVDVIFKF